jgi:hypothetical protein
MCTVSADTATALTYTSDADTDFSVKWLHRSVPPNVGSELALHTFLPSGNFECAGVAPGLQFQFSLNDFRETLRPSLARECGTCRLNQLGMDQVRTTMRTVRSSRKRRDKSNSHANIV